MNREEFDRLVRRVEGGVGRSPAALRWRVAWLAMLGYGLLLSSLFVVMLVASGFFVVMYWADQQGKIICALLGTIVLIGGGWAALRALLVRVPPPEGLPLQPSQAPALFAMLEDLGRQLRCVPFHHVRLVSAHNAAIVQVPRLGVLGWSRNFLLLGLPLLDGHSTPEVRAVLAHEFAHLSRQHGRFSHWIYRLRRSWEVIFTQLTQPQAQGHLSLRPLLLRAINFFWPRFNAHAFVFSRANEYEADAVAARLAGADHIALALLRGALQDRMLDQNFWPDLWRLADVQPAPPEDVSLRLRDALRAEPSDEQVSGWLAEAFRVPTTNLDTHPCLKDRLLALGWPAAELAPLADSTTQSDAATPTFPKDFLRARGLSSAAAPQPSAAEVLLGTELERLRRDVGALWRDEIKTHWEARCAKAGLLSERLSTLEQIVPASSTDPDSLWDKAVVLLDLKGDEAAEPLLRQILSVRPDHLPAHFQLGRILLEKGRTEGEAHLERVMAEDDDAVPQACALLREHSRRAGRIDRLRDIDLKLDRYEKDLQASRAERREVTARDPLISHDLSKAELESLIDLLARESSLARADLARKELRYFPKQKLFLLCVYPRRRWPLISDSAAAQSLVQRLSKTVRLPGRVLVFRPAGSFRSLAKRLARVEHASIYRRQ